MAKTVTKNKGTNRPDSINKKRVWPIEGVNETSILYYCPPACLDSSRNFECQFKKAFFPFIERYLAFMHQTKQIAIRAHIIKAMIMHTDMTNVRCHCFNGLFSSQLQQRLFSRNIIL